MITRLEDARTPPAWYLCGVAEFMKWLAGWESGRIPWPTAEDYARIKRWEQATFELEEATE